MKVLTDIRLWIALGLLCLTLFFWLATGLISTGEPPAPLSVAYRVILLVVLFIAVGSLSFAIHLKSQKTNANVLQDISGSRPSGTAGSYSDPNMLNEEESQLRAKFTEAAAFLKKKRFGRFGSKQHLYQLPWYIVLGSPGSGKTTAIRHSGLDFPLDSITQGNSLGGIGGTRNCDWWITEQAVLLDTAGRYTTQDSDANYDARGWKNFLDLLRKNRKQQPINGAVLVISTDELLKLTDDEWKQHTLTITARLRELVEQLQMDFPVYLLVTKVDLLPGCREFFDSLDADEQDQIWGTTLAPDSSVDALDGELEALARRLHQQVHMKLRYERDTKRRRAIYSFPWQMENVMARIQGLVVNVFTRQGVKEHTQLRGVYFTSAVQEGSPIERLFAAVTGGFGISGAVSTKQQNSRSLFIRQLFPEVIFPEAFLAGTNTAQERRTRQLRLVAFACMLLVGAGLVLMWTSAFTVHRNLISRANDELSAYEKAPHATNGIQSEYLQTIQHLRAAATVFDQQEHPWLDNFGMYDASVDRAAKDSYIRTIRSSLAPALGSAISSWLAAYSSADYQQNLDALKAYLMLANHERRDADWFLAWLTNSPIESLQLDTEGLSEVYMRALFNSEPEYQLSPINETTVERTRNLLARVKPSDAVYSRIKSMYASESTNLLPQMGPYFADVFESQNPEALSVPSLYTVGGYQTIDFGANSEAVRGWLSDRWVIGEEGVVSPLEIAAIINEVKQLYSADYIDTWKSLPEKFELLVPTDTGRLLETMGHLAEPSLSPMSALLVVLSKETSLPQDSEARKAAVGAAVDAVAKKTGKLGRVAGKIASSGVLPDEFDVPAEVARAFEEFHNMLRGDAGSKNARTTTEIGELRQWLNLMQHSPEAYSSNNPSTTLLLTSQDLAKPFSDWTAALAQNAQNRAKILYEKKKEKDDQDAIDAAATAKSQMIGQLNSRWQAEVVQPCTQSFDSRFPFSSSADTNSAITDFEEFFAPDGTEESFVKQYLNPLISEQDGLLSKSALWSIRHTQRIREAFFANRRDLGFTYQLIGLEVDERIGQLIIESGDKQRVRFKHGPPLPLQLTWPDGDKGISVTFMRKDGSKARQVIKGPWAIFRAVSSSRNDSKNQSSVSSNPLVTFSDGDYNATFRISSDSRINPFLPGLLDKYTCRSNL